MSTAVRTAHRRRTSSAASVESRVTAEWSMSACSRRTGRPPPLDGTPRPHVKRLPVDPHAVASIAPPRRAPPVDRVALALAEAILPGTSGIPAADEATVRELAAVAAPLS